MNKTIFFFALLLSFSGTLSSQWTPIETPITTPWTSQVDPNNPLPEYPRPQLVREDWLNLNGYWEYESGANGDIVPHGQTLASRIVVPFPIESTLSEVIEHHERIWYRKLIEVPAAWSGKRILLHFGAIDWESEVYINGTSMGVHKGGYDEISYDITDELDGTGPQEVIVRVYDPTKNYGQPRGKQTTNPGGIMYTSVTGIWQTVWLEPVTPQNIYSLNLVPDVDNGLIKIKVNAKNAEGLSISATVKDETTAIGTVTGQANTEFSIPIPDAKLWSPNNPFLYDLTIELKNGSTTIDAVSSYFGMRKIEMRKEGDRPQIYLNDEKIFMMGPLDQGFWPDGIYTAPTDEALKFDIEQEKALGFNMVRKHIKVEPQRWYYWADKLGILVWQDMPSSNSYDAPAGMPVDKPQFTHELTRMINTHNNSPSIVVWVLFNEWQGQFDVEKNVDLIRTLDPTRLINQGSGGPFSDAGDIRDDHSYPEPANPSSTILANVCGEYGGIGYIIDGHQWDVPQNPYGNAENSEELISTYSGYVDQLIDFKSFNGLCGAVYTEITDVEIEVNGFLTYDRRIAKCDFAKIKLINEKLINEKISSKVSILPTSKEVPQTWKYSLTTPTSEWFNIGFNDAAWPNSIGGFGDTDNNKASIGTPWTSSDIWLRKEFHIGGLSDNDIENLVFNVFYDEDCEIYINGVLAASTDGYVSSYLYHPITDEAKNAIVVNSINTIAVHCHQTLGGQYIDVGIYKIAYTDQVTSADCIQPLDGGKSYGENALLQWKSGNFATAHKLYFGESRDLTETELVSTQTTTTFLTTSLAPATTYYWRVDEVTAEGTVKGAVWHFTTHSIGAAIAFIECSGTGLSVSLDAGDYNLTALSGLGIMDNSISSLQIAEGFKAIIYDGNNFTGNSYEVNSTVECLDKIAWNDKITSLKIIPTGVTNIDGIYTLQNRNSKLFMAVEDGAIEDGANIQQSTFTGNTNQKFQFVHLGNGVYKISALHSSKALAINTTNITHGANVQQETYIGSSNQQFVIVSTGDEYVKLIAKKSTDLVEVADASLITGTNIQQMINSDQTNGHWKLTPANAVIGNGNGLLGNYFNGMEFETPAFTAVDPNIDMSWGNRSPYLGVNPDRFSVRWTGQIQAKITGLHTFYINSDNGRRLWVNNQLIIDKWIGDWGTEYSGNINFIAGEKYDIKLEYFEEIGGAENHLSWSSGSLLKEIVPQSQLYANDAPQGAIISPSSNASIATGSNIEIIVNATDNDGGIAKVEFYNGNNYLGTKTSAPYVYTWNNIQNGQYTLSARIYDNKNAVLKTADVTFNITPLTSVESNPSKFALFISPNPAQDVIYLQAENMPSNLNYVILDTSGRVHKKGFCKENNINVSKLNKGIYFISFSNNELSFSKKFIKK